VYTSKHLAIPAIIGLVVLSYVMTYAIWHQPDPRGLVIMASLLMIGETAAQLRWRQAIVCQHCGFDPVVYMKNPELAGQKIKQFIKLRAEKPEYLLKPALNLPVRRVPAPNPHLGENLSLRG
jgi:hypothetical protein